MIFELTSNSSHSMNLSWDVHGHWAASLTLHLSWIKYPIKSVSTQLRGSSWAIQSIHRYTHSVQIKLSQTTPIFASDFWQEQSDALPNSQSRNLLLNLTSPTVKKFLLISSLNTFVTSLYPFAPMPRLSIGLNYSFPKHRANPCCFTDSNHIAHSLSFY